MYILISLLPGVFFASAGVFMAAMTVMTAKAILNKYCADNVDEDIFVDHGMVDGENGCVIPESKKSDNHYQMLVD